MGSAFSFGMTRRTWAVLALVILSALALEGMQLLATDRHGRILDAAVKVIGGVCGAGAGRLVPHLIDILTSPSAKRHQ